MSTPKKADRPNDQGNGQGVLSNLPRTRPQRSSPRRAAARKASAAAATAGTAPARANGRPAASAKAAVKSVSQAPAAERGTPAPKRPRTASKRPARPQDAGERVPRQGFECESERASGPVAPPGGTELIASAAEIISELAKAGLSSGERLLKDVISRLPLA
jgi:hypothetical protein